MPLSQEDAKEAKAIRCLKLMLLCLLVGASIGASSLVFWYSSNAEHLQFADRFDEEASKVHSALRDAFFVTLDVVDSYTIDWTAYAQYSESAWPWVTLPDFAVRAAKVRAHAKAFYVAHNTLVTRETRSRWDDYAATHNGWVDEVRQVQSADVNYHGPPVVDLHYEPIGTIFASRGPVDKNASHMVAIWQNYPLAVSRLQPYNYDLLDFEPMAEAYHDLVTTQRISFQVINMPDANDEKALQQTAYVNAWAKEYISADENETEPMITLYYPILSDASDSVLPLSKTNSSGQVVAIFDAAIYWRTLIENILPEGSGEIVLVFDIGPAVFTYALSGPSARYVGPGDWHDPAYDSWEQSFYFLDVNAADHRRGHSRYTGVPLSDAARRCRMRAYPSAAMEDQFVTAAPIIYTTVTVLTFLLTSILFVVYDQLRSMALQRMTQTAAASSANAVVLEEMVQERTQDLEATNRRLDKANREIVQKSKAQLQHFSCMSHEIRTPLVSSPLSTGAPYLLCRQHGVLSLICFYNSSHQIRTVSLEWRVFCWTTANTAKSLVRCR